MLVWSYTIMVFLISGTFLTFICMKNVTTRIDGMAQKFKWSLREIGQLTVSAAPFVIILFEFHISLSILEFHDDSKITLYLQSKILHYMRQMAVITPYAQFLFKFVSDATEYALFLSCSIGTLTDTHNTILRPV